MVLGRFTTTLRNDTCLRVMTKNSAFSCFMVIFMSYCPQFLVTVGFACLRRTLTCLRDMTRNSSFSRFYGRFHEPLPTVFGGYRAIYNNLKKRYMFESYA